MYSLAVLVIALAGCWRSSSTPEAAPQPVAEPAPPAPRWRAAPPPETPLDRMQRFSDAMCECRDYNCARRVSDEMIAWSQETASRPGREPEKMTEADQQRATEIGTRMGECMQRAVTGTP